MLVFASHADEQGRTAADVREDPELAPYLEGFGRREGDVGVVAREGGRRVGAAWLRLFEPARRDAPGYVDDETPELAIATLPEATGRGIGGALLVTLTEQAGHRPIVLTVREGNPARRLYERHGFVETGRVVNRVGTGSVKMLRRPGGAPATL